MSHFASSPAAWVVVTALEREDVTAVDARLVQASARRAVVSALSPDVLAVVPVPASRLDQLHDIDALLHALIRREDDSGRRRSEIAVDVRERLAGILTD